MEESPISLKTLASLEAQANEAYSCYLALTKASTKFRAAGSGAVAITTHVALTAHTHAAWHSTCACLTRRRWACG